jgi:hypothetical protein
MATRARNTTAQIILLSLLLESIPNTAENMAAIIANVNIYLFPPS